MNNRPFNEHLSAGRLQAFLDGELPAREVASVEEHLAGCARCSAELDGWRVLFEDLGHLSAPAPERGFADRVMASVTMPGAGEHVSTELLQDFLEGSLAARRAERVEDHLKACPSCEREADVWIALMQRLQEVESFTPAEGFAKRVMAGVEIRAREPVLTRMWHRASTLIGGSSPEHVPAGILQDFVDGMLPARAVARLEAHLESCHDCVSDLQSWQAVAARLETLDRYSPAAGFSERVIEEMRARRAARALVPVPLWVKAAAAARRLVPQTREAWAALSGVAVTPAVIVALVGWAVFSHPTLTLGSLVSFTWWQVADLGAAFFSGLSNTLLRGIESTGARGILDVLVSAPLFVAVCVIAYSTLCVLALRVLYKNLLTNRPSNGRQAHVSIAS